jgi:hypothetical protein
MICSQRSQLRLETHECFLAPSVTDILTCVVEIYCRRPEINVRSNLSSCKYFYKKLFFERMSHVGQTLVWARSKSILNGGRSVEPSGPVGQNQPVI